MKTITKQALFLIIIICVLLGSIVIFSYNNFLHHKNTIINQQQEHLLTIAESISRTLEKFLDYRLNELSIISQNENIINNLNLDQENKSFNNLELIMNKYRSKTNMISLYDEHRNLVYPTTDTKIHIDQKIINYILKSKESFITKEYLSDNHEYSINVIYPIFNKQNTICGFLVSTINLNKLYNELIYPIKPGEKGYAMVKNTEGYILMHTAIEQIGIESIKIRKKNFPQYDWSELEELNKRQIEEKKGYHVYKSRWWHEKETNYLTKKINAYTTMKKDNLEWIISVQMDYKEIEEPIKGYIINTLIISAIVTFILLISLYTILKFDKDRKKLEMETIYLKKLNKAWDDLIKSEARLRHSQKLETIGTLTSRISHEFNNLLSPILGYSEILLENLEPNQVMYDDLLEINKSAKKLKEIIKQLLTFSRKDEPNPKFEYIEINSIVDESINLIQSILPLNLKIIKKASSNEKKVIRGNPTQIQQILLNLYTNSYHAMEKNHERILNINLRNININQYNSLKTKLNKGKYINIQVVDNGCGMDQNTLNQIFNYYYTTKKPGIGTGLGLPVVKGIVESHNGKIFISSKSNKGTIVNIYLPLIVS